MPILLALAITLQVPYVAQEKNGCGAAVIAMVMQYWNANADAGEIHRSLYNPGARGIYASDLERHFRERGFRTFAMRGEWSDIDEHLAKGRPLVVALKPGRGDLHYVVITGVDENVVLKHDPAQRRFMKQHRSEFEQQWKAAGYWTLLALPAQ